MAHRMLLTVFGRLPRRLRRWIVRGLTPSYTVGAVCVVERPDGAIALVRQRYRERWGLPGGLLGRGEDPRSAAAREVREEIGIEVVLQGEPVVVVEPVVRRVDVVFHAAPQSSDAAALPTSPEVLAVEWFPKDALPDLQPETVTALAALKRAGMGPG
jgi:8-oxo-dGTP diphosphatase